MQTVDLSKKRKKKIMRAVKKVKIKMDNEHIYLLQ